MTDPPQNIVDAASHYMALGFTHNFQVDGDALIDVTTGKPAARSDIQVVAAYRFEIDPGFDDASNFYAIVDRKHGTKGLVIDAFDVFDTKASHRMVLHLTADREALG